MKTTSKISAAMIRPAVPTMHAKIIAALEKTGRGTFRQIAAKAGLRDDQVWRRMSELERKGAVRAARVVICGVSRLPVTEWELNYLQDGK